MSNCPSYILQPTGPDVWDTLMKFNIFAYFDVRMQGIENGSDWTTSSTTSHIKPYLSHIKPYFERFLIGTTVE